jgi:hypothetical protein
MPSAFPSADVAGGAKAALGAESCWFVATAW